MTAGDQGHFVVAVLSIVGAARMTHVTMAVEHRRISVYAVLVVEPPQLICCITSADGILPNLTADDCKMPLLKQSANSW